ncbi:MAG: hypothetical protein JO144_06205 [Actinobacteria bacterium]|nr:hypothetical protein [Actinomycetota bacterium]
MFEEVPRERRGLGRWLLAHSVGFGQFRFGTTVPRPVVLRPLVIRPLVLRPLAVGPFVLGGGMLLAAVGGSVAVAAAATVLTASAIGSSGDVPPHPVAVSGPARAPATHAAPTHAAPAPDRQPAASRAAGSAHRVSGAPGSPGAGRAAVAPSVSPTAPAVSTPPSSAPAAPSPTGSPAAPGVPVVPPASASTDPAPSSSGPLGNALVHVSGYDQATGRLAYQFAVAGAGGQYAIGSPQTFSAVLAPAASIVSGGTLCPPAGSSCTPEELGAASGAGFFAEVAIDATGTVRSVVEVDDQASGRLMPGPGSGPDPASSLPS